jgi:choline-sulfatase
MDKPNIILIMTDQQRFDSLSCYGCKAVDTPNLDSIAEKGTKFQNCYVSAPVCTPSRSSLMTGKYIQGHGVYRLYDNLDEKEVLLPKHLENLGYHTALFGKLHVSSNHYEAEKRHPNDGFAIYEWCNEGPLRMDSEFHAYKKWLDEKAPDFCKKLETRKRNIGHIPEHLHMTYWAAERAVNFIKENNSSKSPFFCNVSFFDPHDPYDNYPPGYEEKVKTENIPEPIPDDSKNQEINAIRREHNNSYIGGFSDFSKEDIKKCRTGYYAAIAFLDEQIGKILSSLEETNQMDNTVIIFTSDHGDMLGDHGLMVKGAFFYEPSVKVPMLIKIPGSKENQSIESPVQLHDLTSTILNIAGMEENNLAQIMPDSKNLLPVIKEGKTPERDYAVCCYRNTGINQDKQYWNPAINATMLRTEKYKLNLFHSEAGNPKYCQLFDVENDPYEINDLWDKEEFRKEKELLTAKLTQWLVAQEVSNLGSRGGESIPQKKFQMKNKLK